MPSVEGVVLKKVLPIIYVVDVSGSMLGDKIATVNEAMHESMNVLKEVSEDNADAEIKVGVLKFSSGAQWVTKTGLVSLEDFYWNDLQAAGVTDLGMALDELNEKMTRSSFLVSETGFCLPVFIFMSDGGPTDNWEKSFKNISSTNRWFKEGRKIAIAIGDEVDEDVLKAITGTIESVIKPKNLAELKSLIVAVSASASMLAGQSRMVGDEAKGEDILKDAHDKVYGETDDIDGGNDLHNEAEDSVEQDDSVTGDGWDDDDDWN